MGFIIVFVLPVVLLVLTVIQLLTGKQIITRILQLGWIPIVGLIILSVTIKFFTTPRNLDIDTIYGTYVIDRTKFPGKQADWQYDHFRFEITPDRKFLFYVTEQERIIKSYVGTVTFLEGYHQPRIILHVSAPRHHIIEDKPTLYRNVLSFYYVFHSTSFGNVFFTKGTWKPLSNRFSFL